MPAPDPTAAATADRLRADVEALVALGPRGSAGPGERAAAHWAAGALRDAGAADVAVTSYRGPQTYAWAHLACTAAGLAVSTQAGRGRALRRRAAAALLAAAALRTLEREVNGLAPGLRKRLPAGTGANVTARIGRPDATGPGPAGPAADTIVFVAHLDAARTGLVWKLGLARPRRRGHVSPLLAPTALGIALAPVAPRAARALLAASALGTLDIARSPVVPGANDDATGVAAVLELARRLTAEPPPVGVEVRFWLTGGEEAGMAGMAALLARHALDPARTLVVGLDTLGCGRPAVVAAEGAVRIHRYRDAALARLPAGVERWRIGGWTDPVLAHHQGIPAFCLVSVDPDGAGGFTQYHVPGDVPEAADWDCAAACVDLAEHVVRESRSTPAQHRVNL